MKNRKLKKCLKNYILIIITIIAVAAFLLSAIALDTDGTYVFYITAAVSLLWLALFAYANRDRLRKESV